VKYAYEYTRRRNSKKKMLTLVHKCNVLTHCGDLWVRVHKEMGDKDYPDIKQDYNHVDACTMWFVKQPEYYDVIVTENLFGDIITDLAAIIQGGLGIAAGGNINPEGVSMFEPMGGSAPKYTGKNVINPLATICAGGMMMDTLGEAKVAEAIDKAVHDALASKRRWSASDRAASRARHAPSVTRSPISLLGGGSGTCTACVCRPGLHAPATGQDCPLSGVAAAPADLRALSGSVWHRPAN
jgi:3-isopropylmalate dehydrogenase